MNGVRTNDFIGLAVRAFLGAIFIVASVDKVADPSAFAVSIHNYRILPQELSLILATILPWVELLCGFCLLFGLFIRGSSLLTMMMLFVFTGAVISGLLRGLDISCGCFTQDPGVSRIGWGKVAENTGLILLSGFSLLSSGLRFTVERLIAARHQTSP